MTASDGDRELYSQLRFERVDKSASGRTEWGQAYDFAILIVKFPLSDVAIV